MANQITQIEILGVRVDALDVPTLHQEMGRLIADDEHGLVLNVNVHCMNLAYENEWLRRLLNSAEIVFCDGFGVRIGAQMLGYELSQRITYADWIWQLAEYAETHEHTLYFLGAQPGVAELAAERLKQAYTGLKIVGIQHGYFDKDSESSENEQVVEAINAAHPNILLLGFGMPLQEKWLSDNWSRIDANIALTGGAVFDYISGDLRRAPRWMTEHGLEWLGRLLIEPQRLWRRYLVGNPLFLWRVLKQRLGLLRL